MISQYSALLVDLATRRITAELPLNDAEATEILNAPGSAKCEIPLNAGKAITKAMITPRRNAVVLMRDDTVVPGGEGVIWTSSVEVASNSVTLNLLGWHEVLRGLHLKVDKSYVGWDQVHIVADLVATSNAKPGAVQFDASALVASGRTRDRSWFGWERHSIGQLVENMAAVIDGFHFRYRSVREGEGFRTQILTSYPASGRVTNHVLELGGNVELLGLDVDGSLMTNNAEMIGAGQGPEAPIVAAIDVDVLATTPLIETVETHSDVSQSTTLDEKARRRLALGREPIEIPKLSIGTDVEPRLGSYQVGDQVRVRGRYGLLDVDGRYVITQTTLRAANETVAIDVEPVEMFL